LIYADAALMLRDNRSLADTLRSAGAAAGCATGGSARARLYHN